jgi:hypothetical protein
MKKTRGRKSREKGPNFFASCRIFLWILQKNFGRSWQHWMLIHLMMYLFKVQSVRAEMSAELDEKKGQIKILQQTLQVCTKFLTSSLSVVIV